ncbi:MAG: PKD domain-containing protein [Planctomycetes bacterium]|nr:PKD domain-containing protein [Planctomycetota bacterium]
MHKARFLMAATALAAVASAQFQLVAPDGYANAEGNASNTYPWQRNASSIRIQFIYDSSHFTNQSVVGPIIISNLRYRANATTSTWAGGSWPNVQIDMATATSDYLTPSTTFATNMGLDLTTVHSGAVTVQPGTGNGTGVPGPWYIDIPLSSTFLYDPTSGNDLVVDIQLDGTGWTGTSISADHVSSTGTPPPMMSRVYSTSGPTATTGTVGTNYGAVCEFTYVPANGLFANFTSDVTGGASPLTVNFSDGSYSSDPGGVLGWAWDFDGDSVIDSTLQNPSFVYTACGSYDVTLTVVDGAHAPSTITKTAYISTDAIAADFSEQVVGPLTVLFNDNSSLPATSWAWDLDGDNVVDSTVQNPGWVYANANPVDVTLTVTRLCAAPSTITKTIVPLQQVSQNVAPNNGLSSGASVYFDLDVTNPLGARITALDVFGSVTNAPFTVEMFVKTGTYTGFTGAAEEWVSAGIASGTSAASTTTPSNCTFTQPIQLPMGLHGIKLWYIGTGPRYQTGSGLTTVGNADMMMTLGTSRGSSTVDPWAGSDITPRWWSGTIYYDTNNVSGSAGIGAFAPGCAGTMGVPHMTASGNPTLGSTLTLTVDNLPLSNMIMCTGFSNTTSLFGALPFDATPFGAPGCFLRVSTEAVLFVVGAGNQATWNFVIPNNPAFTGQVFFNQALAGDPTANAFGAIASDAHSMIIGN